MSIIPYRQEHLEVLERLFLHNVPTYFAAKEWHDLVTYLEAHRDSYFAYEIDNQLVGFGGYYLSNADRARLSWTIIDPSHQGKGIGKAIIDYCLQEIERALSVHTIEVWTSQLAHGFYAKWGFEVIRSKKEFWAPGFDLFIMERKR